MTSWALPMAKIHCAQLSSQMEEVNLALARMVGTKIKSGLHLVSQAPEGTVIGSMVAAVGVDASRRRGERGLSAA